MTKRVTFIFEQMTVSTIFLQTTNEGTNEYGDTTFNVHLPAKEKTYKLSVASFMFRPKIILMENQSMTFRFKFNLVIYGYNPLRDDLIKTAHDNSCIVMIPIKEQVQFNPSKIEVTQMKSLIGDQIIVELPYDERASTTDDWQRKTIKATYNMSKLEWSLTEDYRVKITVPAANWFQKEDWYGPSINTTFVSGVNPEDVTFILDTIELVDITPKLAYFSGLDPALFHHTDAGQPFILTAPRCYNPHYWNYITLSCNKSYNTGNVLNQERFNSDIDESSQFYKGQILAYMPNNAYAPEAMQTGMATANEYIIKPADFNSIRFWLNYDNGEPVKLCSPMTIVLNMSPDTAA